MPRGLEQQQHSNMKIAACVADVVRKVSDPEPCSAYMSYYAPPGTSVQELLDACVVLRSQFTVVDAEILCTGLQRVKDDFWPAFDNQVAAQLATTHPYI